MNIRSYNHDRDREAIHRIWREVRVPRRLTLDDWERVHQALLARHRGHGSEIALPALGIRVWVGTYLLPLA